MSQLGRHNMAQIVTYGVGGYNPDMENDNIVEIIELPDEEVSEG